MTFSTIVAAVFMIAIALIIVRSVWSLLSGSPALRRGSGNPGIPRYGSGMPGSYHSHSSDSGDGGGGWGGDGGGGGGGGGD
ncbi:hypothetical protein GCM10009733_042410 [Nonomuraea maheshkhaliensis]|uniref:Uncharacterized protein n=1 Tax=Nonomuraea maheshkhaliensis TaxID=419590 RepID=A0ABN2FCR7_9ACTN